jgi:hypothetical protein
LPLLMMEDRPVDWTGALEPSYRPELQICG